MKVAIMQPYLFPYIGYFQLINAVDTFVFYDDVNFIKSGWIHRNRVLIKGEPKYFSVPLSNQSSFIEISKTEINEKLYETRNSQFLKSLQINYSKAPFFQETFNLVESVLKTTKKTIADLAIDSTKEICNYLSITSKFKKSSMHFSETPHLKGGERLIEMCKMLESKSYINPIGGLELYDKKIFKEQGLDLLFLKSNPIVYKQFSNEFIPNLSIIDVLMFNSKEQVREMLNQYELV